MQNVMLNDIANAIAEQRNQALNAQAMAQAQAATLQRDLENLRVNFIKVSEELRILKAEIAPKPETAPRPEERVAAELVKDPSLHPQQRARRVAEQLHAAE
jgi:hypothetical protein